LDENIKKYELNLIKFKPKEINYINISDNE